MVQWVRIALLPRLAVPLRTGCVDFKAGLSCIRTLSYKIWTVAIPKWKVCAKIGMYSHPVAQAGLGLQARAWLLLPMPRTLTLTPFLPIWQIECGQALNLCCNAEHAVTLCMQGYPAAELSVNDKPVKACKLSCWV